MKLDAAEIAGAPPRGTILTRATGRRAAGAASPDDRCIDFIASDPSVGRDGHRILAEAWQTANFLRNPVFLFAHDDGAPPIGRVAQLRTVGVELRALVRFAERDVYDFADTVYQLYRGGFLNACSTGWLPLEWKGANDRSRPGGVDFTSVELLEISAVPVPALPTALATARSAGIDLEPFITWTEQTLDARRPPIPREELIMMRAAAGAAKAYAAPRLSPIERLADRQRLSAPAADPASGFANFGQFLQAVARAAPDGVAPDRRLVRAPAGDNETNPSQGGYLVPPTFIERLIGSVYDESVIGPLCARVETDRPATAKLPAIDETSRADGSRWGGATSYWDAEADGVSASLPKWKSIDFASKKLFAVCIATRELLADAALLDAYVRKAFAAELGFKLDSAILAGSGAGVPLGILNSSALITVAKAAGQAKATIVAENVESMWARLPAPSRRRAVWLANEDAEQQLSIVGAPGLNPTAAALYMPAGAAGDDVPRLKGRPLVVIEQAPALGTPGDLVLFDPTQYFIVSAPTRIDLSLDVLFASDQGVFRFVWRLDGSPIWSTPISPYNGTLTRSPFVALAQR